VRFKLDDNLSRRAADLIRPAGHDAVTVASEGLRGPINTFVNELDSEGRDPFDLLDEIEQALALDVTPASLPIGMGRDFLGTSSPMPSCCSSVASTTESPSRSGAAALTIRNCRGSRQKPPSPNCAGRSGVASPYTQDNHSKGRDFSAAELTSDRNV